MQGTTIFTINADHLLKAATGPKNRRMIKLLPFITKNTRPPLNIICKTNQIPHIKFTDPINQYETFLILPTKQEEATNPKAYHFPNYYVSLSRPQLFERCGSCSRAAAIEGSWRGKIGLTLDPQHVVILSTAHDTPWRSEAQSFLDAGARETRFLQDPPRDVKPLQKSRPPL